MDGFRDFHEGMIRDDPKPHCKLCGTSQPMVGVCECKPQPVGTISTDWFVEFSKWADDCPENRSVSNFSALINQVIAEQQQTITTLTDENRFLEECNANQLEQIKALSLRPTHERLSEEEVKVYEFAAEVDSALIKAITEETNE